MATRPASKLNLQEFGLQDEVELVDKQARQSIENMIDDTTTASTSTWSSEKIDEEIDNKSVTKEASGNPIELTDAASAPMVKCVTEIQGSQNLHGYDKPWVGGAGKNKLPLVLADIKSANTTGTWSGNTYTISGAIFTVNTDDGGNVVSIIGKGNGSAGNALSLPFTLSAGSYILSSGFAEMNGTNDTFLQSNGVTIARGNSGSPGQSFTLSQDSSCNWFFRVASTVNYVCTPMIRLSTEADSTFTPYSNICPITAYTEEEIEVRGKNILNPNSAISYGTGSSTYSVSGNAINVITSGQYSGIVFDKELPNGTYNISFSFKFNNSGTASVTVMDEDNTTSLWTTGEFSSDTTRTGNFTVTNGIAHIRFYCTRSNASGNVTISNLMLNTGSSSENYEEFRGTTHTTTYPSAIYRGSEDCVKGEVECIQKKLTISSNAQMIASYGDDNAPLFYFVVDSNDVAPYCINTDPIENKLISNFYTVNTMSTSEGMKDFEMRTNSLASTNHNAIYWRDSRFSSAADMNTYIANNPIEIVYRVYPSPTTSSVTPTNLPIKSLSGYNHIESTTGDMEVEYITEGEQPILDLIKSALADTYEKTIYVTGLGSVDIGGDLDYNQSIMVTYYISYKYDNVDYCVYDSYFGRSAYGSGSWGYGHTLEFAVTDKTPQQYTKGTHLHVGVNSYYGAPLAVGVWCNSEDESHITNIDGLIRVVIDRNPLTIS